MHLVGVDGEVLAQHRQGAGGAGLLQVGVAALEEIHVGEHRQARRAAELVAHRDLIGPEVRADHPARGTGLLHLGDHRRVTLGDGRLQRVGEAAHRAGIARARGHLGQRQLRAACGDFFGLAGQDGLQDVAHRRWRARARQARILARRGRRGRRAAPQGNAWPLRPRPVPGWCARSRTGPGARHRCRWPHARAPARWRCPSPRRPRTGPRRR